MSSQEPRGSVRAAAVIVAALAISGTEMATAQHGIAVASICEPARIGQTTRCEHRLTYGDSFGDTVAILEAFEVADVGGDDVRVPAVGNLPIIAVSGNTTAVVGGTLPALIGPPGSVLAGLPGVDEPGEITFLQNEYVVQPGDSNPLMHQFTSMNQDLCDGTPNPDCSTIPSIAQFSASSPLVVNPPPMNPPRPTTTEKGSLMMFSKVDIRWSPNGALLQDTFISMTNDFPEDVRVQLYFVNGDPPLDADPVTGERAHPGWNYVDNGITLTGDQPTYWSALSGSPATGGVAPFTSLDPGFPPGRPAPDGNRMLRGFVMGWAVNAAGEEIRWNHLKGEGTILNYADGFAWEYGSLNYPAIDTTPHGMPTGTPGVLNLDGVEFAASYDLLLMNFIAVGSAAFSGPRQVLHDTDITIQPIGADLRQEGEGPLTTKANFDIWNMNEVKFSGQHRCVTCWDETLGSNYNNPNHFMLQHLQTNAGKARINGLASQVCDVDVVFDDGACGNHPLDICSQASALTGIVTRLLSFDGGIDHGAGAVGMIGMGVDPSAVIRHDVLGPPPATTPDSVPEFMSDVWPSWLIDQVGGR